MKTYQRLFSVFFLILFFAQLPHCAKSTRHASEIDDDGGTRLSCDKKDGCEEAGPEEATVTNAEQGTTDSSVNLEDGKSSPGGTLDSGGGAGDKEPGDDGTSGEASEGGKSGGGSESGSGSVEYEPFRSAPEGYNIRCDNPSDCDLVPKGCCHCDSVDGAAFFALATDTTMQYWMQYCIGVECTDEMVYPNPLVFATCYEGTCRVVELLEMDGVTGCTSHDDCRLRYSDCCGCGKDSGGLVIAVSNEEAYKKLVCDENTECDDCESIYPKDAVPYCRYGRCRAAIPSKESDYI